MENTKHASNSILRGVAALALAASAAAGCNVGTLTAEERETLSKMQLQPLPPSPTNAYANDPQAAQLGQMFFFDKSFSGPLLESSDVAAGGLGPAGSMNAVSCATCHDPGNGGADRRALGGTSLASGWTGRNTPTVINAAYSRWMFWDGRKDSMWSQVLGPIESEKEHNTTRLKVAHTIFDKYREPYEQVFGKMAPLEDVTRFPADGKPGMATFESMSEEDRTAVNRVFANFGKAIEAYERQLVDTASAFDRFVRGDDTAISDAAVRGAKLFIGRAGCDECHSGSMMADGRFHNHGVPQLGPKVLAVDYGRRDGIPQLVKDEFNGAGAFSDTPTPEVMNMHASAGDAGAFKTPTLRNVSKTGPYMHTGNFNSLWDVVDWYNAAAGGDAVVGTRAPASIIPLRLTDDEISDIVEFMRSLDGDPLPTALVTPPAVMP